MNNKKKTTTQQQGVPSKKGGEKSAGRWWWSVAKTVLLLLLLSKSVKGTSQLFRVALHSLSPLLSLPLSSASLSRSTSLPVTLPLSFSLFHYPMSAFWMITNLFSSPFLPSLFSENLFVTAD